MYLNRLLILSLAAVVSASFLLLSTARGDAAARWAVVLGNAEYQNPAIDTLANTVNDARTMAASLTNMGFAVYLLENATKAELETTVARVGAENPDAELGLFFFAGHGLQQGGENFALPADIDPRAPNFLREQGISISDTVRDMRATGIDKLVVVLDSCRNSPFGEDEAFGVGLALVDAPGDTIIAYSTAPGAVALDGIGANSPFTAALASTLEGGRQDIRDVLRLVRAKVRFSTGGAQTPWYIDNSRSEIVIQPRSPVEIDQTQTARLNLEPSLESTAWNTFQQSSDPNDFQLFADLYPDHELAGVARDQVSELQSRGGAALPRMELGVPDPSPEVPGGLTSLITACDVLATGTGDILGLVEPVPHDLVNTRAAMRACIEAVANDPRNPRLLGLLGRVLKLEGRYEEAIFFTLRAIEEGNPSSYGGMAEFYRFGLGVEKDLSRAADYVRQGAMKGSAPLRQVLGNFYRQGWGVPQSFSEARRWLEVAAISGDPVSITALGDLHLRGQGVPKNPIKAMEYYRLAAEAGRTDAMNNIGMIFMRGQGVDADTDQGIRWLSLASEQGNPYAAFHLGRAFRKGWGVEKDPRQALAFLRLSAQRNFLGAYIQIGDLLRSGDGSEKDLARAYANYIIAIKAAEIRDTIASRKNRDEAEGKLNELLPEMTAEEVESGSKIASDWINQYGLLDFTLVSQ